MCPKSTSSHHGYQARLTSIGYVKKNDPKGHIEYYRKPHSTWLGVNFPLPNFSYEHWQFLGGIKNQFKAKPVVVLLKNL